MATNFARLGDRTINLAQVTHIQKVQREVGTVLLVYYVGNEKPLHFATNEPEGQALLSWLENSVQDFVAIHTEESIPTAWSHS